MGFKHLCGFCLLIAGIGMIPLFFAFLADDQFFNSMFLRCLGFGAVAFLFSGFLILKKSR
jgi:hypothetical protein